MFVGVQLVGFGAAFAITQTIGMYRLTDSVPASNTIVL